MSDQELTSATMPVEESGYPVPTAHILDLSDDLDTEMTCPLTLMAAHSTTSRSATPDKMSNFNQNMSRNGNYNQSNQQHAPNFSNGQGGSNWRQLPPPGVAPFPPQGPYSHNASMMGPPPSQAPRSGPSLAPAGVPLSAVCPGAFQPTQDSLNTAYGYGIRRGENSFTRLLPADEYPITGIPALQGAEGLIILPPPVQRAPNSNDPERLVPFSVVMGLPPVNPPPQVARPLVQTPSNTNNLQNRIDNIVQSSANAVTPTRRREKIFCDKWIHDGTCAFTQLGCKYLHQMPLDRATQLTLGLNNGPPNWYRREQQLLARPEDGQMIFFGSPHSGNRLQGPWRRSDVPAPTQPNFGQMGGNMPGNGFGTGQMGSMGAPQVGGNNQVRGYGENRNSNNNQNHPNQSFGPIAPPIPARFPGPNPFGQFKNEKDDDEMLFKGRRNR